MFIGHGALAFAIAVGICRIRGFSPDRALKIAIVAGAFATIPDVDMVYALTGLGGHLDGLVSASNGFWAAAELSHRTVTHSLPVGLTASLAVGLFVAGSKHHWDGTRHLCRGAGGAVCLGLIGMATVVSGPLSAMITTLFAAMVLLVAVVAQRAELGLWEIVGAAVLGLLSHPFGDVFTGAPPAFFYPTDFTLLGDRLVLVHDPTLSLLVPFFLEIGVLWLAVIALGSLRDWNPPSVRPVAGLGAGYAGAILLFPAPSLEQPTVFVLTVLLLAVGTGLVAFRDRSIKPLSGPATGLATLTVAGLAYLCAYLLVG